MELNVIQIALIALALGVLMVGAATFWSIVARRRREQKDAKRLAVAKEEGLDVPASLYPVIDPDLCSGCLSCLDVCPEGDLFGIKDGKAILIEPSKCIGHGVCAEACPTGAIALVFGTKERGVDLPETDQFFETDRKGVHIVGELAGMGLIKNALKQGLEVARYLKDRLETDGPQVEKDIAIVGAGPAGLATAIGCRALNLSFRIIDQQTVGGTIAAYPRQKLVMMDPVKLPLYGTFGSRVVSKEDLMSAFQEMMAKGKLRVHEGVRADDVQGEDGDFTVVTSAGAFTAKKVVLALGRRGTPRKLGVPGEEGQNVTYNLVDPGQYSGKKVLVVGGGDSAIEAAAMLAEEGSVSVAISYRRDSFQRCRAANRKKIAGLIASKKIRPLMKSEVLSISDREVELNVDGRAEVLSNDYVIVNAGGTLPTKFLERIGVSVRRHHGDASKYKVAGLDEDSRGTKVARWVLWTLGLATLAAFTWVGWEYYWLERPDRIRADLHEALRPSGPWGHGIGIVATLMMVSNFLYSGRKRRGWFRFMSLRSWMMLHVFCGIIGPGLVAFHSAFQSNNLIATATTVATFVVVITGLVGRYMYGMLPLSEGKLTGIGELKNRQTALHTEMYFLASKASDPRKTQVAADIVQKAVPAKGNLWALLFNMPRRYMKFRAEVERFRKVFGKNEEFEEFREKYYEQLRVRMQIIFYSTLRKGMGIWRALHVSLALLLVVLIVVHIGVSLYLGFGWILF